VVQLVEAPWLEDHLSDAAVIVVDPRPPVKYLQGHIENSANVPLWQLFDPGTFSMLPEDRIAALLGANGLDAESAIVLYDGYDGQNAAMMAWVLEYLGHPDVRVLSDLIERWVADGREVFYRPVKKEQRTFRVTPDARIRSTANDILSARDVKLLDMRTPDEYAGRAKTAKRGGHIPGAINLPWTEVLGGGKKFLAEKERMEELFSSIGLRRQDRIITYCSYGPRAALGYVALKVLGFSQASVYDGSFNDWAKRADLPVEA